MHVRTTVRHTKPKRLTGLPKRDWLWGRRLQFRPTFTRINPVDSATLRLTQNERSERSNPPVALRGVDHGAGWPDRMHRLGGMVSEANAQGNAWDTPTETTTVGR